ncbi:protein phosphatase 2C domain-containing protein [Streptomyces aureoverticillatus]|uniref:protein phosphatase 2C domain-containing protein n=1 Tax=Streptomyces aureoverticillatus TaxID=66871 RepID=UPI0013DBD241|nr:protein phosphatase 2C domain-containing protein [Streptomyces aureoverticillatus]QIB42936.1 protein phosphatase 2C domain-containing protein [Streptomyces aureoverticillatus]
MTAVRETPAPAGDWELLRGAVKGVAKKYSQDRCSAKATAGGRAVVLAVADGHGSAPHFRSDMGARWAVEEFTACAEAFAHEAVRVGADAALWPGLRAEARRLPQAVGHRWQRRALLHDANAPAHGASPARRAAARERFERQGSAGTWDFTAYGSTLIGAVLTRQMLLCWQLGDGDIVVIDDGGVPHTPLSTGPDMGDETDSLCEPEPWRKTRTHWQPITGGPPPAVLLSTDGLSKSFADHQGFLDFATGVRERAAQQGVAAVQKQLQDWLERAARYSGDDTTLVAAFAAEHDGAPEQTAQEGTTPA